MKLLFFTLFCFSLWAQVPLAFAHLGKEIEAERSIYRALLVHEKFSVNKVEVDGYFHQVDLAFEIGEALDKEVQSLEGDKEEELHLSYLAALRSLEKPREDLEKLFYKEVSLSLENKQEEYFFFLIEKGRTFLDKNSKLKNEVLRYSKKMKKLQKNETIKALQAEKELDDRSYAFMQKMQDEYKAYQEVLRKAQALKLRQLLVAKKEGGVIVYAQENRGDIDFYIENLFEMHVSSTLFIKDIQGYETKTNLPYKTVLKGKQKLKALTLYNMDKKKHVGNFRSHISWSKGSIDAKPDLDFIYALPFHESQKVSQGFNGNTSHKGNAAYAVDFAMDIGTPVYAARSGTVVEVVQRHNRHGMGRKMRQYANYVIIEHSDKTLGRYFHLKQNSVKVKLAQKIKKGDILALSGNTGRTSGPHLHFVVTKAEALRDAYRSMSVPIKFLCSEGILENPIKGNYYCTVSK